MPRSYDNSRRQQQADATRTDILDAVAKHIAEPSQGGFRVPRVAELAGVSTATVYHHFGSREGLMDAFDEYFHERYRAPAPPERLEDLAKHARELCRWFAEHEDLVRVRLQTSAGLEQRSRARASRHARSPLLAQLEQEFGEAGARRVGAALKVIGSSQAWLTLADEMGMSPDEAAELIGWAIQAILSAARCEAKPAGSSGKSQKRSKKQ